MRSRQAVTFQEWMEAISKGIFPRSGETPRILSWLDDFVDEDLEEENHTERA